jgi:diguanylate cyclase (GGDEF)-like protein
MNHPEYRAATGPFVDPVAARGQEPSNVALIWATGRLGHRLLLRIAVVLGLASAAVLAFSHLTLARTFDAFERAAAVEALTRVRTVLTQDSQTLAELAVDYAHWDDFYAHMVAHTDAFIDSNFTVASLRNLRVQGAVVLSPTGDVVDARVLDGAVLAPHLPATWIDVLSGPTLLAKGCERHKQRLVWADDMPLMVALADIRNTAADAPSRGCLLLVRPLDSGYGASLKALTGTEFQLSAQSDDQPSQVALEHGRWQAQGPVEPWASTLSVVHSTGLQDERESVTRLMTIAVVLVFCSALGALGVWVHLLVVRRLVHFSDLANDYRARQDWTISWPAKGRDEIDNLGHSLNELVKKVHWQVEHNATHDPLTGLPNRQGLEKLLAALPFQPPGPSGRTSCLLLIDLDNFKVINDGFGHDVGDALLCHVGRQLTAAVRRGDVVARMGGDEFVVLINAVQRDVALEFAKRILENLRQPLAHGALQVATTGSVGLVFCDGVDGAGALLRNADLAMYQAKQNGRDGYALFNENLKVEAQRRNRLEQGLRQAVTNFGIQVVFQPVVNVVTRRVVGMEALARWSLDGEAVSPVEFIPIAEKAGLIGRLGMQVLDRSCAMVAHLRRLGLHVPCSVNLSLRQFQAFQLVEDVPRVVFSHGLPASAIRLEVTEGLLETSPESLVQTMQNLQSLGFEFLLDDFGTGHSSLYRLQSLPFHTLKIDRSFVLPLDQGDDVMVRTVTDLARELQVDMVAEGVETHTQLQALVRLGIAQVQGFVVARPMSDSALLHWFATSEYACGNDSTPFAEAGG